MQNVLINNDLRSRFKMVCQSLKTAGYVENMSELSLKLGYKNELSIYQVFNGKAPVPIKLVDTLVEKYPLVSREFIVNGGGEMFLKQQTGEDVKSDETKTTAKAFTEERSFGDAIEILNAIIKDYQCRLSVRDKQIDRLITLVEVTNGIGTAEQTKE